mgnify:CR=1 FL=1
MVDSHGHATEESEQRAQTSLGSYNRYTKRRQKTVMERLMTSKESKRRGGMSIDETLRLKITHRLEVKVCHRMEYDRGPKERRLEGLGGALHGNQL